MSRPSLALTLIVKNEAHNLPVLLESVKSCCDKIYITDTGSTDGTIELIEQYKTNNPADTPIELLHFKWCNDFAKARNHALPHIKEDYWFWNDADDSLMNPDLFILWRDNVMQFAEYWLAKYIYATDAEGRPACEFARERVIKNGMGMKFGYFLHEGVKPFKLNGKQATASYITTWCVKHRRSMEDQRADKGRNLKIFEHNLKNLDARMEFYYGKELFENGQPKEAYEQLVKSIRLQELEPHDRILGHQYAAYAAMQMADQLSDQKVKNEIYIQAIGIAHLGLQLDPNRAEFNIVIGDAYLKLGRVKDSVPFFAAAKYSHNSMPSGGAYSGALFTAKDAYGQYPRNQLARCLYHLGDIPRAQKETLENEELYHTDETRGLLEAVKQITSISELSNNQKKCNDIVITTPPVGAYPWDEELAKTKPMGGSEFAAIEMAKQLKKMTGHSVKIFNAREDTLTSESGVEYLPAKDAPKYFSEWEPRVHIAWRHNCRLTKAKSYLWSHDLSTPGVEIQNNFDHFLALSPFHKRYTMSLCGVPEDKIIVTRNGCVPERFNFEKPQKDPKKILWLSSPDRGLDRAIEVMDVLVKRDPELKLHVYYGIENLRNYGPEMKALADKLSIMMDTRSYIVYHGFTKQEEMFKQIADGVVWLHPNNFIETFCLTALETLCLGIYPVTRRLGALQDTLKEAEENGMATMLDFDCISEEEVKAYADAVMDVLDNKKWENVSINPEKHSWESVAKSWVEMMEL